MRSLAMFFAFAFVGVVFIPMMLLLLTFLFALKPYQCYPSEEDWDAVLAEGECCEDKNYTIWCFRK